VGDIHLRVVTPKGVVVEEAGLDEVVVRRRETGAAGEAGSEIAVLRRHGPLLMATAATVVRYRRGADVSRIAVEPGVTEVLDEIVTILVPSAARL